MAERFESVDDVTNRLRAVDYLADRGISGRRLPRRPAGEAGPGRGPGRCRQDRVGQGDRRGQRLAPHPPPVLRGPRRGQGALRVELQEAAAAHPGRQAGRHRLGAGRGRHLLRAVPAHPPPARGDPRRGADRAAHRRGRPGRDRDRGAAARSALRLPGVDPRAGHDHRPRAFARSCCSPRTTPGSSPRR